MTKEKIKQLNRVLWTVGRNKQTSRVQWNLRKICKPRQHDTGQLTPKNTLGLVPYTKDQARAQAKAKAKARANNIIYGLSAAQKTIKARQTSWRSPDERGTQSGWNGRSKQISMQVRQPIRTPKFSRHKRTAGHNGNIPSHHMPFMPFKLFFLGFSDLAKIMKSVTDAICCLLCLEKKPQVMVNTGESGVLISWYPSRCTTIL